MAEGWCDCELYVWSWFVRISGTKHNLNDFAVSPLVQDIESGKVKFSLDGNYYIVDGGTKCTILYSLGDGIDPD